MDKNINDIIIELCSTDKCTGCGACFNICPKKAITMKEDKYGFYVPDINNNLCIKCNLCTKVCPELNPVNKNIKVKSPIALINKDNSIVKQSTSGGMFSLMADYIINNGGNVYGAKMDNSFETFHVAANNKKQLSELRGSKYVQSSTRSTFSEVKNDLKNGKLVLYTGTPCQIAGLINFLGNIDRKNLITSDIVCHGTPSNLMFKSYIKKLAESFNVRTEDINDFRFREYEKWDYLPSCKINGKRIKLIYENNVFMNLFLTNRINRECCYKCRYATQERVSDITIADFWGISKHNPLSFKTPNGCSMVLLNTDKGASFFNKISELAQYEFRNWDEALKVNHQLYRPLFMPQDREEAIKMLLYSSLKDIFNHFINNPKLKLRRLVADIFRATGILKKQ